MPEDRVEDVFRPALRPEDAHALGGMLLGPRAGGVRKTLIVEVVDQPGQSPALRILAELLGVGAHGDLDREHVLAEGFAGRVLVHQRERVGSGGERLRHDRNMRPEGLVRESSG
jgi:hypothetical protein